MARFLQNEVDGFRVVNPPRFLETKFPEGRVSVGVQVRVVPGVRIPSHVWHPDVIA